MKKYAKKTLKTNQTKIITAIILVIVALFATYSDYKTRQENMALAEKANGKLAVHYIDIGQGDATLILSPDGSSMLIDCGPTDSAPYLIKYLNDHNVESIEYLVLTHPHEDHYGGAERVIEDFPVENLIIHEDFADTYPFDRYINKLAAKPFDIEPNILLSARDDQFLFAECAPFGILSPEEVSESDYNESSLAIKLIFGDTAFLFTGDAEAASERRMLADGYDVRADVLHAGHHGSSTSNTTGFVESVAPEYAVISCEQGNDYGHPHQETLATFRDLGITVLRTDTDSSVVIASDGKTVQEIKK